MTLHLELNKRMTVAMTFEARSERFVFEDRKGEKADGVMEADRDSRIGVRQSVSRWSRTVRTRSSCSERPATSLAKRSTRHYGTYGARADYRPTLSS